MKYLLINIDEHINKLKQSHKLLDKLNYHTKRENSLHNKNNNNNIKEDNKTKEKLKSMKILINKMQLINNNSSFTFKDNYNISKININKDYINIFNHSNNSNKNSVK